MCEINLADFNMLSGVEFIHFDNFIQAVNHSGKPVRVEGISTDSRRLKPAEIFWALCGENFDGHDFVTQAQQGKALFSVISTESSQRFEAEKFPLVCVPDTLVALQELARIHRKKFSYPLLALTGSNGKTTTKEMIHQVLGRRYQTYKTAGNFNNHIGCPLTLLGLEKKYEAAVIELGTSHPGEIAALAEISLPDQALVTNIGSAHLEFFQNKETVAAEKLSLFDKLQQDGTIYKNLDDPFIQNYDTGSRHVVTFATNGKADVVARLKEVDQDGRVIFRLNNNLIIHLQTPGEHNLHNALAAASVGVQFGIPEPEIKDALENFKSTDKRMQVLRKSGVIFLNDSYNSNPDSAMAALKVVQKMRVSGKIFIVLGDMLELGEHSNQLHQDVIRFAEQLNPDLVLLFGERMHAAAVENLKVQTFNSHEAIVSRLQSKLQPGDLVLLKGSRGMAMEKILDKLY